MVATQSRPTQSAVLDSLESFVSAVESLRRRHGDDRSLAGAVAERLGDLLQAPDWLPEAHRQPSEDSYRQHVMHVAPDGGFSVVCLVWRPGQRTPIHDHVAWCVVGVYQGQERETRYALYRDEKGEFLVEKGTHVAEAGHVVALVPPDENIHRVTNGGEGIAVSIHVYGADIQKLGTSINRRFDHLPIRGQTGAASPVVWRRVHYPD